MREVPVHDGFGVDVHRCPLSDTVRSLGLSELCECAMCDVDSRDAEKRGVCPMRSEALASGAERCTFRCSRDG
jgi:hypothetical protein